MLQKNDKDQKERIGNTISVPSSEVCQANAEGPKVCFACSKLVKERLYIDQRFTIQHSLANEPMLHEVCEK
jgi:hypothetical protein